MIEDNELLDTFYNEGDFAEPFTITPVSGTAYSDSGLWNASDASTIFNDVGINNDLLTVTFRTYKIDGKDLENATIVRNSKTETYYAIDIGPDVNGETLIKLSRNSKQ